MAKETFTTEKENCWGRFAQQIVTVIQVGEVLERLKSMIRLKEEEPAIPAEGMTEAVFCQRLSQWNEAVMAGLHRERKVIPNLYQPRVEAEQELKGWIGAQAPLLVIAAEAGSGKTNLLFEMARQYSELESQRAS